MRRENASGNAPKRIADAPSSLIKTNGPFSSERGRFSYRNLRDGRDSARPETWGHGGDHLPRKKHYSSSGLFRKQEQTAPTAARGVSRCMAGERPPQRSAARPRTGANMPPTLTATPRVMPEAKPMLRER